MESKDLLTDGYGRILGILESTWALIVWELLDVPRSNEDVLIYLSLGNFI